MRRTRIAVGVGLVLLIAGCVTVAPRLDVKPATTATLGDRINLNVAVLASPSMRSLLTPHEIPGGCFSAGMAFAPSPIGDTTLNTVRDRFARIFETVTVVDSQAAAKKSDAIFEVSVTDVGYKLGCLASPNELAEVKGTLRAMDPEGRELWRSPTTSGRLDASMNMSFDFNQVYGDRISTAIGRLVDRWTLDITSLRQEQYAFKPSKGGSQVARNGRSRAAAASGDFPETPVALTYPKGPTRADDIVVIIGNADYGKLGRDIPNVLPAYADAEGFRQYVTEALGVREGNVILLRDATSAQMVRVFGSDRDYRGQLYDWVRPGRSRVYVYYSGHGAPGDQAGGAYLVPSDADAARINLNGYPLETLYRNLAKLPAETVTVVLEACFSGTSQAGTVIASASPIYRQTKAPPVPAKLTVIAAGAADQIASWEKDKSQGLFTKYFLTGMAGAADKAPYGNGDGRVEMRELDRYLKDTLTYYARRYYGRDQNAQIIVGGVGS